MNNEYLVCIYYKKKYISRNIFALLPIQCKGIVELHVRMSHGVEGWEFLQSLHQLHDGVVILDSK